MKHIFLMLAIIFLLGCGSDDPVTVTTASRSVADYMYDGPVGTEYWYKGRTILTDTNDRTQKIYEDTLITTILNRAYPHPSLGACVQVQERRISAPEYADTSYFAFNENVISFTNQKNAVTYTNRLLVGPLKKGTLQSVPDADTSMIREINYPMTTAAGNFSTVYMWSIQYYSNKVSTTERNFYFAPNALFCKIEVLRKRRMSSGDVVLHTHDIRELIAVKKP